MDKKNVEEEKVGKREECIIDKSERISGNYQEKYLCGLCLVFISL